MEQYVDGFLLSIPRDNVDKYREMSSKAGKIWKEYGALDYRECLGDDMVVEGMTSLAQTAGTGDGEVTVFAYIVYANRAERDRINAAVMNDPRLKDACDGSVFDFTRMSCGGFKTFVHV